MVAENAERDDSARNELQTIEIGENYVHRPSGVALHVDNIDNGSVHWTALDDKRIQGQKTGLMSMSDFRKLCELRRTTKAA
jgi:hypothetical protein